MTVKKFKLSTTDPVRFGIPEKYDFLGVFVENNEIFAHFLFYEGNIITEPTVYAVEYGDVDKTFSYMATCQKIDKALNFPKLKTYHIFWNAK